MRVQKAFSVGRALLLLSGSKNTNREGLWNSMQQGKRNTSTINTESLPPHILDDQSNVTLSDLLHRTGFGIKVRFLFALTLIAILPAILLVLVLGNPTFIANNRDLFAGRNTLLLLLGIFVAVVLVATWMALPIVRPIRRATRVIETTTEDVRKLARDARVIAEDHTMGTTILTGASKRLSGRRQTLIRDTTLIARTCQDALPHLQLLHKRLQETRDKQAIEELSMLYRSLQQIHQTATTIADGFIKDTALDQLDQAMLGAREIAKQFEAAGKQLEKETEHLETAARSLI